MNNNSPIYRKKYLKYKKKYLELKKIEEQLNAGSINNELRKKVVEPATVASTEAKEEGIKTKSKIEELGTKNSQK